MKWWLASVILFAASIVAACTATAQRTVSPGTVTIVQSQSETNTVTTTGTQCVWQPGGSAIGTGHTVVGFVHSSNQSDSAENYPTSVTDNAGNTYNLTPKAYWAPWLEDIGLWYLMNVQGNPNTFYFSFPTAGANCNLGFTEYAGAQSIVVANPALIGGTFPSITIMPTAPSLIWLFAANFSETNFSALQNSGFTGIIDNWGFDNIGVWRSNSTVSAGPLTLTVSNPYGSPTTECASTGYHDCQVVLAAVEVSTAP